VNWEQDGIKWLLNEVISADSYMTAHTRLEFLKGLVDKIENLDEDFPSFPFRPKCTIRQYVESNLDLHELEYVDMVPPLVPIQPDFIPVAKETSASASLPECEIVLRAIRSSTSTRKDDVITISNNFDDTFNVRFVDMQSNVKSETREMLRSDVLKYLSNTLRLMTLDSEPYESFQILPPNSPTILLRLDDLTSQTRDLIYDTVESVMDNWPYAV